MRTFLIVFVALVILISFGAWGVFSSNIAIAIFEGWHPKYLEQAAMWGDSFGGFNALFSASAFAILALTLVQQGKAINGQAEDLHKQRFEGSFFQLLDLMRELRSEIIFQHSKEYVQKYTVGRGTSQFVSASRLNASFSDSRAIDEAVKEIHFWLTTRGTASDTVADELVNVYMWKIHSQSESTLGPYFRIIYTILRRISDDKILSEKDKVSYGNLVRSQLTSPETVLLAINSLAPISNNLEKYVVEFRILKYMSADNWVNRLKPHFHDSAFKPRD